MINFKKYFHSHLRANIRPFIYILIATLVLTFLIGINNQPCTDYDHEIGKIIYYYESTLYVPVDFLSILVFVFPVMEFSFFKKRINLDCAYSLPISRRAMGTVHYLTGLIMLFSTFTASYLLNFVLLLSRGPGWFNFEPMIAHYLFCLLLGFATYSVMVFVFNEANTKGDGIWFMILYTFVFALAITAFGEIIGNFHIEQNAYGLQPWAIIGTLTTCYQDLVENTSTEPVFWQTSHCVVWFIFWMTVGIASAVGFFLTFGKRRMEKTEEISDSYFGFRVLIPVYAIAGMIVFGAYMDIIVWVIIALLALLGYTIYRRGFHYKKSDILILCLLLIFLFV